MATPMLADATQCAVMRGERQTDSTQGDGRRARAGVFNGLVCVGDLSFAHVQENKVVLTSTTGFSS